MSDKPVIFISHSSKDEELANELKKQIEACFEQQVVAFVARYSIAGGENWLPEILTNLKAAQAFVIIVSSSSATSRWVGIEIGYVWNRINGKGKNKLPVYPLCFPGSPVFSPLDGKQGKSLDRPDEVQEFFQKLIQQFTGGELDSVSVDEIIKYTKTNWRFDNW